eukprot:261581_1
MKAENDELQNLTHTNNVVEAAETDDEAEEVENMVRVITHKDDKPKQTKYGAISVCVSIGIVIIVTLLIYMSKSATSKSHASSEIGSNEVDWILPNVTVVILTDTDTSITGELLVSNAHYEFKSISNKTAEYIEFIKIDINDQTVNSHIGFRINHLNHSKLVFELYDYDSVNNLTSVMVFELTRVQLKLDVHHTKLLDSFMQDVLGEHFIELSIKLGSLNYTGSKNHAIQDLHGFAIWIWKYESTDKWVDFRKEFEKVNELLSNSSYEQSHALGSNNDNDGQRKLLGNCGSPFVYCNNDCFGMCGIKCFCVRQRCGDCECWLGCQRHDYECCINGYSSYCCINMFWFECDGSGSCEGSAI